MNKLTALAATTLLLAPTLAMAQMPERPRPELQGQMRAELKAEVHASTSPSGIPKLGPAIKNIASTTRAIGASTTEMVKARVEAIKEMIAKKREEMRQRADEARQKAKERFGEKVEMRVGNISARLASTSAHLSSIADRVDTRIDALEDQGLDMSASIALLAQARTDLSLADDKIVEVNEALEAAMSTTTPKAMMPEVRAAVKAAQDALKLAKDDLMKTIASIRKESATSTPSN